MVLEPIRLLFSRIPADPHLPLWVEFTTDRSDVAMADVLGADIDHPDPFGGVPD